MKIRPVGAELFHADRQTEGQTDMAKLVITLRNSGNAPKNNECYTKMLLLRICGRQR